MKHLLMMTQSSCGKHYNLEKFNLWYSIVMDFADDGDLLQKVKRRI